MLQPKKNTITVNLLGGPGSGKSTLSAGLFYKLKTDDVDCELVREFAKELVWEKNFEALRNQFFVTATQSYRQSIIQGNVDVLVTDSPLIVGLMYFNEENIFIKKPFEAFVVETFKKQNNMNFLITRKKKYNPNGRNQNADEAKEIDEKLKKFLDDHQIPYTEVDGNKRGLKEVYKKVTERLEEK